MKKIVARLALCAAAILSPVVLHAQGVTSDIRGIVNDTSGAVIAGATVTINNLSKGWTRTAQSGGEGSYEFLQLTPADTYSVSVGIQGFRKEVRSGIVLQTGQQTRIDFALSPGDVSESVTVEGDASMVQTEDSAVGAVVDQRKVTELPLNGRQFWQLAQLVPNVLPPAQNSNIGFRGGFNVSGHTEVENNYLLDGVDNADQGTMQPTMRPSVEGIQEFKVLTGVYAAEYGRYSGGQVLVTTKSGSNTVHGTVFEFLRNSAFDARNFFGPHNVPAFRRNQFGLSNGGPIRKNRTFYFATYEGLRLTGQTTGLATVPTTAMGSGNLTGFAAVRDFTTGAPFPGNQIPQNRLDPISQKLLKYWPAPTATGTNSNYNYSLLGTQEDNQFSGRIDHIIRSNNTVFGSYQFAQRSTLYQANTVCGSRVLPDFGCQEPERTQSLAVNDVHTFSPVMVNELRLGYNRIRTNRYPEDAKFGNVTKDLGIPQPGPSGSGIIGNLGVPLVNISGYALIGANLNLPQGRRNNTYNIVESFSWIRNRHTLKLGFDYKYFIYNYANLEIAIGRGQFTFNGQTSGNAFADFLLNLPRSTNVSPGDPTVRTYNQSDGLYAQDDWRISRNLTLNFGLRWELFFPQKERLNKVATFDPRTGLVPVGTGQLLNVNAQGQLVSVGSTTIADGAAWQMRKTNIAPRFGAAWRPFSDDKTVLRAGFGIFYNSLFGTDATIATLFRGIPFRAAQTFTNPAGNPTATWTNAYPGGNAVGGFTPYGIDYSIRNPYVQQWTLGVERQLVPNTLLEMTYLGSKGTNLAMNYNLNQPTPAVGAIQARRPWNQWGNVTWVNSGGNSTYHSLAMRLERRYSNGFSALSSYTWSHAIDLGGGSGGGTGDGESAIMDPRNVAANKGNSTFDIKHRSVTSVVYELPFGEGKAFGANLPKGLRYAVSGWEMTGIMTFQSGPSFSVTTTTDVSNTGGANRPFVIGDPHLDSHSPTRWFNTAAFTVTNPFGTGFAYGNTGRNNLRGDGQRNLDFGMFRNFKFSERLTAQFRGELFNILNTASFGLPAGNINASNFGQVTSTSTSSRQIQLGLKVKF